MKISLVLDEDIGFGFLFVCACPYALLYLACFEEGFEAFFVDNLFSIVFEVV